MIEAAVFYLFAFALLFSAVLTVTARQPVMAVLFLIWSFFNAAGLFLGLGAEFLAFILLIVYVGAVAVLFLFVVMMLDVRGERPRKKLSRGMPVALGVFAALLMQMAAVIFFSPAPASPESPALKIDNTLALGRMLYTEYFYPFQVCGLILLVAMIGAIVLSLRAREGTKRQNVWTQLCRSRKDVLEIRKIKPGEGAR